MIHGPVTQLFFLLSLPTAGAVLLGGGECPYLMEAHRVTGRHPPNKQHPDGLAFTAPVEQGTVDGILDLVTFNKGNGVHHDPLRKCGVLWSNSKKFDQLNCEATCKSSNSQLWWPASVRAFLSGTPQQPTANQPWTFTDVSAVVRLGRGEVNGDIDNLFLRVGQGDAARWMFYVDSCDLMRCTEDNIVKTMYAATRLRDNARALAFAAGRLNALQHVPKSKSGRHYLHMFLDSDMTLHAWADFLLENDPTTGTHSCIRTKWESNVALPPGDTGRLTWEQPPVSATKPCAWDLRK